MYKKSVTKVVLMLLFGNTSNKTCFGSDRHESTWERNVLVCLKVIDRRGTMCSGGKQKRSFSYLPLSTHTAEKSILSTTFPRRQYVHMHVSMHVHIFHCMSTLPACARWVDLARPSRPCIPRYCTGVLHAAGLIPPSRCPSACLNLQEGRLPA